MQPGQPLPDKVLLLASMASYAVELVLTGLDRRHWRWAWPYHPCSPGWGSPSSPWDGCSSCARSKRTPMPRPSCVIKWSAAIQCVDAGVYGVVRHPMYAGLVAAWLGAPVWLRSPIGLGVALVPIGLLAVRLVLEERVLVQALPATRRMRTRPLPARARPLVRRWVDSPGLLPNPRMQPTGRGGPELCAGAALR